MFPLPTYFESILPDIARGLKVNESSIKIALFLYIYCIFLLLKPQLTRDERSDNEEEEEEESSLTEDEAEEQHKLGNGSAVDEKDKNGCFGCLSPPENICRSKTVY